MIDFNEMTEFVRPIHEHIKDLFILDIEALYDFSYNLKYYIPDSLRESKFHAPFGSIHKESSNGFMVGEAFSRGEDVVLHGRDGGHCYLRGEVPHLVLAQSEVLLALLEDDFQGPTSGVNPVGFKEVKLAIGGNESVPLSPLVTLAEEQADVALCKGHVNRDVIASQTAAIPAPFFATLSQLVLNLRNLNLLFLISQCPVLLLPTRMIAPSFFNSPRRRFTVASDAPTIAAYSA